MQCISEGVPGMIIRIRKFHVLAAVFGILCVSFLFALKAEKPFSQTFAARSERMLPVVMYHHITENPKRAGKYVILSDELRRDLEYIKNKGYETVCIQDLIDFVDGKNQLPEKIVMITFDDGFESVMELAQPILRENNQRAVLSVVGSITESYTLNHDRNINYAYLGWDELRELQQSGDFEIQNHTYDMHNLNKAGRRGMARKSGESPIDYENALTSDLMRMQQLLESRSKIKATAVTYPYGSYSGQTLDIVKKLGFRASLVCEERVNRITRSDSDCLFNLGRYNRPSGMGTQEFFEKLGIY